MRQTLGFQSPYDTYRWAEELFEQRDYYGAARLLRTLLDNEPVGTGAAAALELLARSYFHSAQLEKAAEAARELLELRPDDAYAAVLLTRTLERSSRHEEAASARRLATALGAF